jgi:putative ABC transport system permease protein
MKMKPFSALKFFAENKKKGLMTFIVLIFTVCAVSLITTLINSIFDSVNETSMKLLENVSFVSYTSDTITGLPQDVVDKMKNNADIDKLVPVDDFAFTNITLAIGGNTSIPIDFSKKEDSEVVLKKIGDTVKEGRMPDTGKNEIAVHWKVMNNKGWKLDQTVGSEVNEEENLNGKYKIVGILDGPSVMGFGGNSYGLEKWKTNGIIKNDSVLAYAVLPKEGKMDSVNKMLDGFDKKKVSVNTYTSLKKELDKSLGGLSTTMLAIIIIVVFILSVSIGTLMYLIYLQRSEEFGILSAMGYRRSFIRWLIIKEVISLNLIGWVAGTLFSMGVIALLNYYIYLPKGTPMGLFSMQSMLYTLIIPAMVTCFSLLPILTKLRHQDAITIIERRD